LNKELPTITIAGKSTASYRVARANKGRGFGVGKLYEYCAEIQRYIDTNGLDVFRTRGALAIQCGFLITLVEPGDVDDPKKIDMLKAAALDVLGLRLD
jgi:hypothetical protein